MGSPRPDRYDRIFKAYDVRGRVDTGDLDEETAYRIGVGFARLTGWVKALAESLCGGRLVCLLEGGYNLDALERSVVAHLRELSA